MSVRGAEAVRSDCMTTANGNRKQPRTVSENNFRDLLEEKRGRPLDEKTPSFLRTAQSSLRRCEQFPPRV